MVYLCLAYYSSYSKTLRYKVILVEDAGNPWILHLLRLALNKAWSIWRRLAKRSEQHSALGVVC